MSGNFYRLPINVTFEDKINHVGVEQHECVLCGDCVTGCNYGAKNSVLMNYLPDARNHGAEIFTQVAVRYLERKERQWLVHYEVQGKGHGGVGSDDRFLTADIVILAGNALGSTEILLRSRQYGLQLSPLLGKGFTGNGDVIGFSYNGDVVIDGIGFGAHSKESRDPVGPCITGIIDLRGQPDLSRSMVIEEASIPGAIAALLPEAFAAVAALENRRAATAAAAPGGSLASGRTVVNAMHRELESVVRGPYHGAVRHTQTLAIMTHDDGDGEMYLEDDRLRIRWPGVGDQPIFQKAADMLEQVSEALGGRFLHDPVWGKFLHHHLVTVHPMGGCIMGDDVEHGVVNHKSQVFDGRRRDGVHEGLYVCDGSVVPRSLGVNPLLTISALAERSCCLIAEEHGWTVNYTMPSLVGGAPCT